MYITEVAAHSLEGTHDEKHRYWQVSRPGVARHIIVRALVSRTVAGLAFWYTWIGRGCRASFVI